MIMEVRDKRDINERIAERVRLLRSELGLSLDALASRSGVSRSALSLIERAESSATAVVLDRLAPASGSRSPRCSAPRVMPPLLNRSSAAPISRCGAIRARAI